MTISSERFTGSTTAPGFQSTYGALIAEYPELADDIMALTSWRDSGQPDQHSVEFNKMYPSLQPHPWTA